MEAVERGRRRKEPGGEVNERGDPPSSAQPAAPQCRPERGRAARRFFSRVLGALLDEDDEMKCEFAAEPLASSLPHTSGLARAEPLSADKEQGARKEKYKCLPDQMPQAAVYCAA